MDASVVPITDSVHTNEHYSLVFTGNIHVIHDPEMTDLFATIGHYKVEMKQLEMVR